FFFQAEDGIRDDLVTGVQTCALPISPVQVTIRDFHSRDFETLWRIDQQCFAPGISYSRPELAAYMHAAGSFTLVAESQETPNTRSEERRVGKERRCGRLHAHYRRKIR